MLEYLTKYTVSYQIFNYSPLTPNMINNFDILKNLFYLLLICTMQFKTQTVYYKFKVAYTLCLYIKMTTQC